MVLENIQGSLYLLTLLTAASTALFGFMLINLLFTNKLRDLFSNKNLFIFFFLVFGYACFALAELCWYLMYKVFTELPAASMPDFYWVIGSISLLIAFTTFSVHMYKLHGRKQELYYLLLFGGIVLGVIVYYISSFSSLGLSKTTGHMFLSYFYPVIDSLILISSISIYLFLEKMDTYRSNMLIFFLANIGFLFADVAYVYSSALETYGIVGILSDILYIAAYTLCSISLLSMYIKTRESRKNNPEKQINL